MRTLKIIFLALFLPLASQAQHFVKYSEVGLFGGGSYYLGDLNPGKQFFMIQPAAGLIYRYNPSRRFAWRIHAMAGRVQADDALSKNPYQKTRNLSFRSPIIEFGGLLEFNFFDYEIGNSETPATPFIFAGLAMFRYNPQALLDGQWIPLQPLGTEGQGSSFYPDRKNYSLLGVSLPFGVGIKCHLFRVIGLTLEWGLRKTFTDYIDDVSTVYADPDILLASNGVLSPVLADRSLVNAGKVNTGRQRGNETNNDWYSFVGLTISIKLTPKQAECAAYK